MHTHMTDINEPSFIITEKVGDMLAWILCSTTGNQLYERGYCLQLFKSVWSPIKDNRMKTQAASLPALYFFDY